MSGECMQRCPTCNGSGSWGAYPDDGSPAECSECGGDGLVTFRCLAAPKWQPIETAPKDGTPIILTGVYPNGVKWVEEGRWQAHTKRFSGPIEGPTAWQPLPQPPSA